MIHPDLRRLAAFAENPGGGNPAGVLLSDVLPPEPEMQRIAAALGYSETAFAAPEGAGFRVRYFAPTQEVAFCGHATIALGSVLAEHHGPGRYPLFLQGAEIAVEAAAGGASLISPPTRSAPAAAPLVEAALALFGWQAEQLDPTLPPTLAHAGNDHLLLALKDRATLAALDYDLAAGAALMAAHGLTTINLLWAEGPRLFHSRNAFAIGGVAEDPATGAAAAALGGALRDLGWPHGGAIEIRQGEDMGRPSHLRAEIGAVVGEGIRVSGKVRAV